MGKKLRLPTRVRGTTLMFDSMGRPRTVHTNRGPREMEKLRKHRLSSKLAFLEKSMLQERDILRNLNENVGNEWEVQNEDDDNWIQMDLGTSEQWEAGEPLVDAVHDLFGEIRQDDDENTNIYLGEWARNNRVDHRIRTDRILRQQQAWNSIFPSLVDMYLQWDRTGAPPFDEQAYVGDRHSPIKVFDIFDNQHCYFPRAEGVFFVTTMAGYGYIGNAPLNPSCAFSIQMLELFRVMNSRCPQLSIQCFVRGICDLHQSAYAPTLRNKFSSAFDVYLEIVARTTQQLQEELGRNTPDWRLQNACPACTFKTPNEPLMQYSMFIAMDGNNSLRRMPKAVRTRDENGKLVVSEFIERPDSRSVLSDLYLPTTFVDKFKNEVKRCTKSKSMPADALMSDTDPDTDTDTCDAFPPSEGGPVDGTDQLTPCVSRWTNLADETSKKMWGIFHETGIFLAVCRHGIALLLCDMVRSGELAKYPLALIDKLIDTYGNNLMIGYDIGCGFSTTAERSPKVGPKIRDSRTRFCVGSFHGHAHCRLCQLDWHPLYIEGCGLEDFETCERCFSESNSVAGATRHASTFHHRQAILNHFSRWNVDKYAELSQFIVNNYRQALQIINENTSALSEMMRSLNISSITNFVQWLHEEKAYLLNLKNPTVNDYQMLSAQYVRTLKKLEVARAYFETTSRQWVTIPVSAVEKSDFYLLQSAATQSLETSRARGLDSVLTLQTAVRHLEIKLDIKEQNRWTPESSEWIEAEVIMNRADYQAAINKLEGLVVGRLFELLKLNQSGIGVKMRTHIAKALKVRSKAIRKAILEYNLVASEFERPPIDVDKVLQYVSLGEFDLLRESQYDMSTLPWMHSSERAAALLHFKIQRAREEISRLNIEVKRLYTYTKVEEKVWEELISRLQSTQPDLAFQAAKRLKHLLCLNWNHERRLVRLEVLAGYSGPLQIYRMNCREGENNDEEEEDGGSDTEETQVVIDAALSFVDRLE